MATRLANAERVAEERGKLLEEAQRTIAELSAALEARAPAAAAPSVAAAAAAHPERLRAIEAEIATAFAAKDGKQVIALLRELAKIGRESWPLAAKLMVEIEKQMEEGNPLGIVLNDFYKLAFAVGELHADALEKPTLYDARFRRFAAYTLPWSDVEEINDIFLRQLPAEQDAAVARAIAAGLLERPEPGNAAGLYSALEQQTNPAVRLAIAKALRSGSTGGSFSRRGRPSSPPGSPRASPPRRRAPRGPSRARSRVPRS